MAKKTPPKRRGPRPEKASPPLEFEPWTRDRQQSVIGGIAAILAIVALSIWMGRETVDDSDMPPPIDVAARRASLAEATAKAREGSFAKVTWGAAVDSTPIRLGGSTPVTVPNSDGRAVVSLDVPTDESGRRSFVVLTISVLAGERRLFGSMLNSRDAAGSTDALTISFNVEAVRAAGIGTDPLTVRVEGFDATGRHSSNRNGPMGESLGEALVVLAP